MTTGSFEVSMTHPPLKGFIEAVVHEHGGVEPLSIVRTDQEWAVALKWRMEGGLVQFVAGKWQIHLYLESVGPGPELRLPQANIEIEVPINHKNGQYEYEFRVPPGVATVEHTTTLYKVVAAVTYITPYGDPGPMAGFVEGPILQFYEPAVS